LDEQKTDNAVVVVIDAVVLIEDETSFFAAKMFSGQAREYL
jgi:hypothetical protein